MNDSDIKIPVKINQLINESTAKTTGQNMYKLYPRQMAKKLI